jgi:hypothetical protein
VVRYVAHLFTLPLSCRALLPKDETSRGVVRLAEWNRYVVTDIFTPLQVSVCDVLYMTVVCFIGLDHGLSC